MFNPPTQITQGQNTPVTLRKTLHNNGPFGPVNVGITASATAPTGCTATASAANPNSTTLPVSTAITVDEVWTLNCSQTGAKSFNFDNAIAITTAHVNDPNGANNSASTTLDVTVVPAATPTPTPNTVADAQPDADADERLRRHEPGSVEPLLRQPQGLLRAPSVHLHREGQELRDRA